MNTVNSWKIVARPRTVGRLPPGYDNFDAAVSWRAAHRSRCSLTLPSPTPCRSPSRPPPTTWWPEALTNTAKHAHAGTVQVQLDTDHTDAGDAVLRVWVRDDGRGGADAHDGSGLVGLTDRVDALGGRLWLHSPPGAGTTVRAELPLRPATPPRRGFGCSCDSSARPTLTD